MVLISFTKLMTKHLKILAFPPETSFVSRMLLAMFLGIMAQLQRNKGLQARVGDMEPSQGKKSFVSYEKRWFDPEGNQTGASRFWGPIMEAGDEVLELGLQIWYRCEACGDWFPIPWGYVAVEEAEPEEDDMFFSSSN